MGSKSSSFPLLLCWDRKPLTVNLIFFYSDLFLVCFRCEWTRNCQDRKYFYRKRSSIWSSQKAKNELSSTVQAKLFLSRSSNKLVLSFYVSLYVCLSASVYLLCVGVYSILCSAACESAYLNTNTSSSVLSIHSILIKCAKYFLFSL